jgi:hyperosmotically inducible protein
VGFDRFRPDQMLSNEKEAHTMNHKLAGSYLALGILMLPISAHSADTYTDHSSAKAFVKDSVITTKVKADLAEKKLTSLVHIGVDTDDQGRVTLSGTSASRTAVDIAVSVARAVKGVTAVDNQIKIVADK